MSTLSIPNDFYLFLDESGNHGLTEINASFPVFALCGTLMSSTEYQKLRDKFNEIKTRFWNSKEVIFHSRDIRKCQKEFSILLDLDTKAAFYTQLNNVIIESHFTVIASAIQKEKYIKKFGRLSNDVYELCLSFIIERAIFFLDDLPDPNKRLFIIIEERGKKEDEKLKGHFQKLLARGTGYVKAERLKTYHTTINFRSKKKNVNGLQLADLTAYPVASFIIEPKRPNPAYEIISKKVYSKNGRTYGLKVYP